MASETSIPLQNPMSATMDSIQSTRAARPPTKSFPYELREQVQIYFEEGLFVPGIDFLTNLLTSGLPASPKTAVFLPPPSHIALLSTLTVHPTFTNRAKADAFRSTSRAAHRYLRLANSILGPKAAGLVEAFTWPEVSLTRRGGLSRRRADDSVHSSEESSLTGLRSPFARDRSLYWKTTDFWTATGWSFRCSVLHRGSRWPVYELWLEYMLDVIEQDFNERETDDDGEKTKLDAGLEGSMIAGYVRSADQRSRVLRAIFADGSVRFANEFPEIWKNETKAKAERAAAKVGKIDLENDEFGDYLDVSTDEEQESGEETTDSNPKGAGEESKRDEDDSTEATAQLGGHNATRLRIRLFALLMRLSEACPDQFGNIWTLYDLSLEYFRPLPLPVFSVVISPPMLSTLPPNLAITFVKFITHALIETASKRPKPILDQKALIASYLPCAANTNTFVDNAKLSVCFETLARLLDLQGLLQWSADLEMAVEKGIAKRESRATTSKGKKGEAHGQRDAEQDRLALQESTSRLRMLVHFTRLRAESSKS